MLILVWLLFLHFVGDFILQPRWMAERKSTEFTVLLKHLAVISVVFTIGAVVLDPMLFATFVLLNALIHGIIDWNIWSVYKWTVVQRCTRQHELPFHPTSDTLLEPQIKHFKYWNDSWFYNTIGLDQFLHGATIIILYGVLS